MGLLGSPIGSFAQNAMLQARADLERGLIESQMGLGFFDNLGLAAARHGGAIVWDAGGSGSRTVTFHTGELSFVDRNGKKDRPLRAELQAETNNWLYGVLD